MALINCPECNKQISDTALKCIGCGTPVINIDSSNPDSSKKKWWKRKSIFIPFIIVLLTTLMILYLQPTINKQLEKNELSSNWQERYFDRSKINPIKEIINRRAYDLNDNFIGSLNEEGRRIGSWSGFYKNNVVAYEGVYENGLADGYFKHFYENGELQHEGAYIKWIEC